MTTPHDHAACQHARPQEISHLIAWMRRLSDAGIDRADPAELAAFRQAKQALLARIGHHDRTQALAGQPGDPVD